MLNNGGRRIAAIAGAIAAAALIAACGTTTASKSGNQTGTSQSQTQAPPETQPPAPPVVATPNPEAKYNGTCDYTLGGDISSPAYLTGEIDIDNTGNIGLIARATIRWPQLGSDPITMTKSVKVPYGATGMPVPFKYDAGSITSGSNIIDNLQSWQSGHMDQPLCTYKVTIVNTYGPAH